MFVLLLNVVEVCCCKLNKDLRALTLVGPTRENPGLEPLAVLHLNDRLSLSTIAR